MSETAVIARKAADHIEKVGWRQGQYFSGEPGGEFDPARRYEPCCVMGAAALATGYFGNGRDETARLLQWPYGFERDFRRYCGSWVTDWNDAPGRTKDEVVSKLREFADWIESKENEK